MTYVIAVNFLGITVSEETYYGDFTNLCFHLVRNYDLANINYRITIVCIDSNED